MKKIILLLMGLHLLLGFLPSACAELFFVRGANRACIALDKKTAERVPLFSSVIQENIKNNNAATGSSLEYIFKNSTQNDLENFESYVTMLISTQEKAKKIEKEMDLKGLELGQMGKLTFMIAEAYLPNGEGLFKVVSRHLIDVWKGKIDHQKEGENLQVKKALDGNEFLTDFVWENTFPKVEEKKPQIIKADDFDDCFDFEKGKTVEVKADPKNRNISFFTIAKIVLSPYKKYIYGASCFVFLCAAGLVYKVIYKNA